LCAMSNRRDRIRGINAVARHEDQWYPTPAGLLFFYSEPQRYLPQSSVEFLHLWGPELTSLGPDGSRWRLNREVVGTLPQIIEKVETLLLERIATRGVINCGSAPRLWLYGKTRLWVQRYRGRTAGSGTVAAAAAR
jgi:predicted HTH transcriptional regulator